jgi:SAM-dependent methyltransferase
MVYLDEIPSDGEISELYKRYSVFKNITPRTLSWWQVRKASWTDLHIRILKSTGGLSNNTLTEIGCAFGAFLQVAKYCGATVAGVELDENARSWLSEKDIPSNPGLSQTQKCDIICAFQLIEHLANPGDMLAGISNALVDDGRLLLAMPNGGEFEHVGESWIGFRVDLEHLNYFSIKTISRMLAKYDLAVEQFWIHSQPNTERFNEQRVAEQGLLGKLKFYQQRLGLKLNTSTFAMKGSFVLSVLARKIPSHDR